MKSNLISTIKDNKHILTAIIMGFIGSIIGGILFFVSIIITGWMIGFITLITGAIASFLSVFGYKISGGNLRNDSEVKFMKFYSYFVGLLSGVFAYFGVYFLLVLLGSGVNIVDFAMDMGYTGFEFIFIAIGAFGGKAGLTAGIRYFYKEEVEKAERQMEQDRQRMEEFIRNSEKEIKENKKEK